MQEPNITSKVPHPENLSADVKNPGDCSSCESSSREPPNNVPMSICFLVREQAKSQVAIQDLQKRLSHVENVQVDVIDTLMQFRNYLCDATNSDVNVSPSYLTDSRSPIVTDSPKYNATTYHTPYEPVRSILKNSSYPVKPTESLCHELQRATSIVTIQDQPLKHFDSTKSKDSALESDKQDSGLDSDCRDHNEGQASVRIAPNWVNHDTNDQLLQLLDEISCRSEYLQKQLAVVDESSILTDVKEEMTSAPTLPKGQNQSCLAKSGNVHEASFEHLEPSGSSNNNNKLNSSSSSSNISQDVGVQVRISASQKFNSSAYGFLEAKQFHDGGLNKNRIGKNIDSTLVSSILKETNVVDLQRQALIYLVDNSVLHNKLRNLEQALLSKTIDSDKVENCLKEEARLLMMENRELRISLDEQRMESNVLKSRVAMLERVLQSMNVENQELNWQLGETLNLKQFSKNGVNNLSSNYNTPANIPRSIRKSASLPSQACQSSNLTCSKSKLLSNTGSFLDATAEEELDDVSALQVSRPRCRNGPIQSSTPFQRPIINAIGSPGAGLPNSFYSIKKCLKSGHSFDSEGCSFKTAKTERYSDGCDIPEACMKNYSFSPSNTPEGLRLPAGNVSKFPFNSILEKLKANSEYRLSRSVPSAKDSEASASASDLEAEQSNASASQGQLKSQTKDLKSPQVNGKSSVQTRKSRNIHQRIQNILDRIVAESEEAS